MIYFHFVKIWYNIRSLIFRRNISSLWICLRRIHKGYHIADISPVPHRNGYHWKSEPLSVDKGSLFHGGEREIRTLGTGLPHTRFPVVRLRPAQPSLRADFAIISHLSFFVNTFFTLFYLFLLLVWNCISAKENEGVLFFGAIAFVCQKMWKIVFFCLQLQKHLV